MKNYKHLTADERDKLAVLMASGTSIRQAAIILHRDKSTISREVRRNAAPIRTDSYHGHAADERAKQRWKITHHKNRLKNNDIRKYVETKIRERWSPEIIAGRISIDKPGYSISHEAIYQYIYAEARYLIPSLLRSGWERRKRGHSRKHKRNHIPDRVDISLRPAEIGKREKTGDWESDSVVSSRSLAAVNALVERVSRYCMLTKMERKSASATSFAIISRLCGIIPEARRSITYDNGSENVEHTEVARELGLKSYFCAAYHSWEKGSVENVIGIFRRWFPKKTDFAKIGDDKIKLVEDWLNNLPRKCLEFKTPLEVFNQACVALAG